MLGNTLASFGEQLYQLSVVKCKLDVSNLKVLFTLLWLVLFHKLIEADVERLVLLFLEKANLLFEALNVLVHLPDHPTLSLNLHFLAYLVYEVLFEGEGKRAVTLFDQISLLNLKFLTC